MSEQASTGLVDEASELLVQRLYGEWSDRDQRALEVRLADDQSFAQAYRQAESAWVSLDTHAEAPEIMSFRAEAMTDIRRANARRWFTANRSPWRWVAAAASIVAALALVWQFFPYGYKPGEYRTDIGEQRMIELDDHSRVALDAATRLKVRFSDDTRTIHLLGGQAQFSVAKDSARPFKVLAGDRTIVALGTVFTVEYVDRKVHVTMLEGKVAVLPKAAAEGIALTAGQELRVARDGRTTFTSKADMEAATAWRNGKVIFRTEPLGEAVERMNRYARLQIEVTDGALSSKNISGVFEAGDTRGFIEALQRYLPVTADYTGGSTVQLRAR